MRWAWLGVALLVAVGAGASLALFTGHQTAALPSAVLSPSQDRLNAKPTEGSLLRASGMPLATTPVAVPGGYEAAAWDETGRVTFWRWTRNSLTWGEVGASTYPVLPRSSGTPSTTIAGALLTGMRDATFIADGGFSGDGTGNAIAFTNGPHGWGTIAPGRGFTLIPTGNKSTDNTTPGNSYTELFHDGDLEISEPGTLPFGTNSEEWQVGRTYAWSAGAFRQVSTTQFTAALATPLPATAPPFPTASCPPTLSGTYKDFAVSASTTFSSWPAHPYLPTSVMLHVQSDGPIGGCDFTVTPDFPVVISATTASGTVWVTAPAWALTRGGASGNQDIGNLLPGTQLPGQYGMGSIEFQDPVSSPYYIPKSFGIRRIGQFASSVISIQNGQLTALTLLPS